MYLHRYWTSECVNMYIEDSVVLYRNVVQGVPRDGQYLNTLYLNTVFKYFHVFKKVFINTFIIKYFNTVFKYFFKVFKYNVFKYF